MDRQGLTNWPNEKLAPDWHGLALDWLRIGTRLASDWLWIGSALASQVGSGLASDWLRIGLLLVQDWHRIGRLAPDCQKIGRLAPDWRIGTGLADWHRIGNPRPFTRTICPHNLGTSALCGPGTSLNGG